MRKNIENFRNKQRSKPKIENFETRSEVQQIACNPLISVTNEDSPQKSPKSEISMKSIDSIEARNQAKAKVQAHKNYIRSLLDDCDNTVETISEPATKTQTQYSKIMPKKVKMYENVRSKIQNAQKQTMKEKS